jgi:hypothetical protein
VDADEPGCFLYTPGRLGCPIEVYVVGSGFAPNATYTATDTFTGTYVGYDASNVGATEAVDTASDLVLAPASITANSSGDFLVYDAEVGYYTDDQGLLLLPIGTTLDTSGGFLSYNDSLTVTIDGITDVVSNVLTSLVTGPVG